MQKLHRERRWTMMMMKAMMMKKTLLKMMTMTLEVGQRCQGRPAMYRRQAVEIQ
jgi:hypothetical protein